MAFDAVNIGPADLRGGIDFLTKIDTLPLVNSNFFSIEGNPVFPWKRVIQRSNLKIGIIGVTPQPSGVPKNIVYRTWQDVLPELVPAVKNESDVIVLLSSLDHFENIEIAKRFEDIRVIISSVRSKPNFSHFPTQKTLITQTISRGQYLGYLAISNSTGQKWAIEYSDRINAMQDKIKNIERKIDNLPVEDQRSEQDKALSESLFRKKRSLQNDLAQLEKAQSENDVNSITSELAFYPINQQIKEDSVVAQVIEDSKAEIRAYNRREMKKKHTKRLLQRFSSSLAGFEKCSQCHEKQSDFWRSTDHAKAIKTLERAGEKENTECLLCHVTLAPQSFSDAYGRKAFLSELPETLHSVGCESCHGAGTIHSSTPSAENISRKIPPATCLNCHTPERDNDFNFERDVAKVACPPEEE